MEVTKPTVVVTGIAGDLAARLLPMLSDYQVVGVDLHAPRARLPIRFVEMDLGLEDSCREMFLLLREVRPVAVIHLAFVMDQVHTGILDTDRMWHINVAGTARLMEAISEANRDDFIVEKFIFPSSVAVYGPSLPRPVTEEAPLQAHTLPYALHKMEADQVVQQRAPSLRGCSVYLLRPPIMAGASMENYMIGAFRGTPNGPGKHAAKMRNRNKRLSCLSPYGKRYLERRIQFIHVDDVARLIAYILARTEPEAQRLTVLNVAGRGEPLTFARCVSLARVKLRRLPGKWLLGLIVKFLWKMKISAIPPEALPYLTGEYVMNTDRLKKFLAQDYEKVIRYTVTEAFTDSFRSVPASAAQRATVQAEQA